MAESSDGASAQSRSNDNIHKDGTSVQTEDIKVAIEKEFAAMAESAYSVHAVQKIRE
jgi:hypothetical protein